MKQYTHAWLALMACKRLYEKKDTFNDKNKKTANRLLKFLKQNNDGIVQGAWFPDSIIHDNSTGHIWKTRWPHQSEEYRQQKHTLPLRSKMPDLVSSRADNEKIILDKGILPDRCQAIVFQIRDQLKILYDVAYDKKNAGSAIIATNNQIALGFFMLAHYVCDAHMPLHCDSRNFGKRVHDEIEEHWEDVITNNYDFLTDPTQKEKRFKLDYRGLPKLSDDAGISGSFLEEVIEDVEERSFQLSFGADNRNVWDYMVDICYYSYLVSTQIILKSVNPSDVTITEYRNKYEQKFLDASPAILGDAIDALARIWFHVWRQYEEIQE